jgi:hypothetical protein
LDARRGARSAALQGLPSLWTRATLSDGKTATTVTFTAPGEYLLRVQANDISGEGGGGFQCCWTNAHVKVTVK